MVEQPAVNRRVTGSSPVSVGIALCMPCWVYILQNPSNKFYIGHTDDLQARVFSHNRTDRTLGKFSRKNGPWTLVWSEQQPSRSAAASREKAIKRMKSAKWIREVLLSGRVPTRRD